LFVWFYAGMRVRRPSMLHLGQRDLEFVAFSAIFRSVRPPIVALFRSIARGA
jgi:hypothetical protein